jgi:hypothetical protein
MIKKIEISRDWESKLYISKAWDANEKIIIDESSDARPEIVVKEGKVVDILYGSIQADIAEFRPFRASAGIHELK